MVNGQRSMVKENFRLATPAPYEIRRRTFLKVEKNLKEHCCTPIIALWTFPVQVAFTPFYASTQAADNPTVHEIRDVCQSQGLNCEIEVMLSF